MLKKGDLKFTLHGKRLKGSWVLVHMKGRDTERRSGSPRENWLLIKHRDDYAKTDVDVTEKFTTSVTTGRDLDGIAKGLKSKKKTAKALEVPQANVWTRSGAVALPKFQPPQLATLVDDVPTGDNWVFEMKYDGYRAARRPRRRRGPRLHPHRQGLDRHRSTASANRSRRSPRARR